MRVVVDTNVLVSALSNKSIFHELIQQILNEKLDLLITDDIVFEYAEILAQKYAKHIAYNFLISLEELPNVQFVRIYFQWRLLNDEDDNKFVDCAIAGNADYIVTNDTDFNVLKSVNFPKVNIITIQEFLKLIN